MTMRPSPACSASSAASTFSTPISTVRSAASSITRSSSPPAPAGRSGSGCRSSPRGSCSRHDTRLRRAGGSSRPSGSTAPEILTAVTVPTLRAWYEWIFGRLDVAVALVDPALAWLDQRDVSAHHLAFDTLITGGWCRLGAWELTAARDLADRAVHDAELLGSDWARLQAGFLGARCRARRRPPERGRPPDRRAPVARRLRGLLRLQRPAARRRGRGPGRARRCASGTGAA